MIILRAKLKSEKLGFSLQRLKEDCYQAGGIRIRFKIFKTREINF